MARSTVKNSAGATNSTRGNGGGQKSVRSLARGLQILSLFAPERPTLSVGEISRELGLAKSSTYRFVATLRDSGYVTRIPHSDRYTLDTQFLRFGEVVRASTELERAARPHLERLAEHIEETVVLVVRSGDRGAVVEVAESPHPVRFIPTAGWSFPLHCGSSGKLLLAYLSDAQREQYLSRRLEKMTERTIVETELLEQEFANIRRRGFATCFGECMLGVRTLAAPVNSAAGTVVAAVAVAGPAARLTARRERALIPAVVDCGAAISAEFGRALKAPVPARAI